MRADAEFDQIFANGQCPAFPKAAIVFGRPAFIRESGEDDCVVVVPREICHALEFGVFICAERRTVEPEIDGRKLAPVHVRAEERHAFLAFRQRCSKSSAADVIAIRAAAAAAGFARGAGAEKNDGDHCGEMDELHIDAMPELRSCVEQNALRIVTESKRDALCHFPRIQSKNPSASSSARSRVLVSFESDVFGKRAEPTSTPSICIVAFAAPM